MKFSSIVLKIYAFLCFGVFAFLLGYVIFFVAIKGFGYIDLKFITQNPKGVPFGADGGINGAIIGSFALILLASIIASLLAVACAFYNSFFCTHTGMRYAINVSVQCIASVPSVLFGLFVYGFFIVTLDIQKGLLSAAISVALMMFATIEMSVQKLLDELDLTNLRDALALGIGTEFALLRIVLPTIKGEILAAVLLAASHGIGATAPLLLTGVVLIAPSPNGLFAPVMALPFHLHMLLSQSLSYERAYATTLVLMAIIVALHAFSELAVRGGVKFISERFFGYFKRTKS